jgi:hypothetical protein
VSTDTIKRRAHVAGLWYFTASVFGVIGLVVAPGKLIVEGDAAATAAHIRTMESWLRIGMGSDLLSQAMFIYCVASLYRLFEHVDRHQARMMFILGALVSVPITYVATLNYMPALYLAKGGTYFGAFDQHQLDALSYLFIRIHGGGIRIASIFWGLWLFPFGRLVIESGFIPRWLGWLLFAAGVSYVADTAAWVLAPQWMDAVGRATEILRSCELPIIFWLVIWGARGPGVSEPIAPGAVAGAAA